MTKTKTTFLNCVFAILLSDCLLVCNAQAGLIILAQNTQLASGGNGTLNVLISSNGTDNVDTFQYKFAITGDLGNVGSLRFSVPQSNSEVADSNYIHSDSDGFTSEPQNSPAYDEILGGDFTASFLGTDIDSTQLLLARFEIEHILPSGTPASAAVGDVFTVSLVNDADTFFLDNGFSNVDVLSTTPGQVTLTAIPEPSSLMMFSALVAASICGRRKRS